MTKHLKVNDKRIVSRSTNKKNSTHIGKLQHIARPHIDDVAVGATVDAALVERHNVLRQRAGFVREYVLDLAEFLVQCGGAGFRWRLGFVVEHFLVPIDEKRLNETDDLQRVVFIGFI